MTDRDIIDRVNGLFPCTSIQIVNPKPVKAWYNQPKTQYGWRVSNPEAVRSILYLILPHLGERRSAKAYEALAHLDSRPGPGGYLRARTHCAQGHEYTPENTLQRGPNHEFRRCRMCQRVWSSTQNAKRPSSVGDTEGTCQKCGQVFGYRRTSRPRLYCTPCGGSARDRVAAWRKARKIG